MSVSSASSSSLSSLSPAPSTDDEAVAAEAKRNVGIERYFKPASSADAQPKRTPTPPPPPRPPSPPHEYVLADNPDITFIVMFRARFSDCFPKSLPHFGPQDIERDVADIAPGEQAERLLCALIGLVLNRKKDVERGHYQRALEEVIQTHSSQWPRAWQGKNPLHGGRTFATMSPEERLTLLKTLILWSLSSSDAIQARIKESYKQSRRDDDINQPLSVQPWGTDARKRRYWLIEGRDDTHFRLYRESFPTSPKRNTWWSVAGTIDELRAVADSLVEDRNVNSRRLSEKIYASIPRFEASEEKWKRRDYRLARKAAFARPKPGFSLYEGRTRGKKMKYTYSDDEDESSLYSGLELGGGGGTGARRSARNRQSSPVEQGPVYTASGRQVKTRQGGVYGEILSSSRGNERGSSVGGATGDENGYTTSSKRPTRAGTGADAGAGAAPAAYDGQQQQEGHSYMSDDWNSGQDRANGNGSDEGGSHDEWENGDGNEDDDDDDADSDGTDGENGIDRGDQSPGTLVVRLQYRKTRSQSHQANGTGTGAEGGAETATATATTVDADNIPAQVQLPSSPPPNPLNGSSSSALPLPLPLTSTTNIFTTNNTAPTSISVGQSFGEHEPHGAVVSSGEVGTAAVHCASPVVQEASAKEAAVSAEQAAQVVNNGDDFIETK